MSDEINGYQDKSMRMDASPDQGLTANQRRRAALQELDEARFSVSPLAVLSRLWELMSSGSTSRPAS